ncbi:hypothetical protein U0070_013035 [Myodes glareolus]|uniref:Fork-head domain-containing protein n=1 Tax=Myodes glareolus TaxID=447135 RepID=A0AAW0IW42_MYOGA
MAEAPQVVETDPDFEPLPRQRSCTWPLPRPEFNQSNSTTSSPAPSGGAATNPDATATLASASAVSTDFMSNLSLLEESEDFPRAPGCVAVAAAAAASRGLCGDFQGPEAGCVHPAPPQQPPPTGPLAQPPPVPPAAAGPLAGQPRKSSSSRRNAWGNLSYADLITKAIESSAEKRLTLSQIYEWMVKSVPYFKDKGDSNSSAGWKLLAVKIPPDPPTEVCAGVQATSRFTYTHPSGLRLPVDWLKDAQLAELGAGPQQPKVPVAGADLVFNPK